MSITVTIPHVKKKIGIQKDIVLDVRKTLGEQFVVFDHPDVDIVIIPESNKVLALAKHTPNDEVYDTQDRLFLLLRKEGIVDPESIKAGFVYGSMEGQMFLNEDIDMVQVALYGIDKFITEEKPYFEYVDQFEKAVDDYITEPTDEDSTPLGEVPQEPTKGSIRPGWIRGPYGMSIMTRI
tara:strand:+ start:5414 stop:5953 length:540 start_codon:yes stop_codon:yes gene_type:complete